MNRSKLVSRSAATIGVAVALAMASGVACASSLTFSPTFFISPSTNLGYTAAIDPTTGLAWVSPNIAANETVGDISNLCSITTGLCTGSLSGLTWANDAEVNQFWKDIGIPINTVLGFPSNTQSYSSIGENNLGDLISFLGPTQQTGGGTNFLGWQQDFTDYLGGITNNFVVTLPIIGQVPNTSYMFHFYSFAFGLSTSPTFDNESAFTYGAGNGTAQDPPTGGWFYFTPG
ncbi:MAG: hypothetical protein ACREPY_14990, partial [Rhodanobacteraceae bacterium]